MDPIPIEDISPVVGLAPERKPRERPPWRVIAAGALGLAVLLVGALLLHRGSAGGHPIATPAPAPAPAPAGTLADGLTDVTSLVDADGYLWAAGNYGPQRALVHVQIDSRRAAETLVLDPPNGASQRLSPLATFQGRVYAVRSDGGVQVMLSDGTSSPSYDAKQLGSDAEALAGSSTTGLWLLSCCGSAPAAQQLAQQRDPATLEALGDRREISAIPSTLIAAGPAGVWVVDAGNGALRRVDAIDTPENDPVVEAHPERLANDLFAVDSVGPVLATDQQLLTVDAMTLTVRTLALPAGVPPPTAMAVTGTTAYLAFPDRVEKYDLMTLTDTRSIPIVGATALTAGTDGVWAATGGRLVKIRP